MRFRGFVLFVLMMGFAHLVAAQARLIAPGDMIKINCEEEPVLNKEYTVTSSGLVILEFVGGVQVSGLSEEEASKKIAALLLDGHHMARATVRVQLVVPDRKPIKVQGAVALAAEAPYSEGLRLADVLKTAQPTQAANLSEIEIRGADGKRVTIDFTQWDGVKLEFNPVLQPGDNVLVPVLLRRSEIFVFGGVDKPGLVAFKAGMTLREALDRVGGLTSSGDKTRIRVEREENDLFYVDLSKETANAVLKPGDRITVQLLPLRGFFNIQGDVVKPGKFEFRDRMTIAQAVAAAGGATRDPKKMKVTIVRGEGKKKEVKSYDFGQILEGYLGDVELKAGDTVIVGRSR